MEANGFIVIVAMFRATFYPLANNSGVNVGIAPFCVQTKALTSTASLCASTTGLPLRIAAQKEPVKESPAPTVSATSTFGVSWNDI